MSSTILKGTLIQAGSFKFLIVGAKVLAGH